MPILSAKKKHFIRIFTEEFKRELTFLWDVLGGRSVARADFTDSILDIIKESASRAAELCPIPVEMLVEASLGLALDYWNEQRKAATLEAQLEQVLSLDEAALDIILDTVALEIACRYEYFIDQRLEEGALSVVPLAQAAIARMLSHIAARKLPITEANLLQGLVAGASGARVSSLFNTELPVKVETKTTKQAFTRRTGYTAEGLFGRSGFLTPDGTLWVLPRKSLAYHNQCSGKKSAASKSRLAEADNYGYTHVEPAKDPKYLAYVSAAEKTRWYGHVKDLAPYPQSSALQEQLKAHQENQQLVRIDRRMLENFLEKQGVEPGLSLLHYVRSLGFPGVELVLFTPAEQAEYDLSDLNLEALDLSDAVFNHCRFGGSLKGAQFKRSYLRGADFSAVRTAEGIDLAEAHLEHLRATGVNFKNSNLTQANLSYADLRGARLMHCVTLGAVWVCSIIEGIETEQSANIMSVQTRQFADFQLAMKGEEELINPELEACRQLLEALHAQFKPPHPLLTLGRDLFKEQQQRAAFKRWSQQEITGLMKIPTPEVEETQAVLQEQQVLMQEQAEKLIAFRCQLEALSQRIRSGEQPIADIKKLDTDFNALLSRQHEDLADFQKTMDTLENKMYGVEKRVESHEERLAAHAATLAELVDAKKTREEKEVQMLRVVGQLTRERYLANNEIKGLFGQSLQLEGQYINVQMLYQVSQENGNESREEVKAPQDARISSFEDLFGAKMALEIPQLFSPAKSFLKETQKTSEKNPDQAPRLLLIQGRAGIGKTTFVNYVAREWAAGRLWAEYPWVFVLRLRDLRNPSFASAAAEGKAYSLCEWVYYALYAGQVDEADFKRLWDQEIEARLESCLFILDGYDELPEEHPCQAALNYLLTHKTPVIPKIITSRPYGLGALPSDRRELEVVGFVDENVEQYVKFFYGLDRQAQAASILSALRQNTALWGNAHIPVTLNIICGVLEEKLKSDRALMAELSNLGSMSGLYQRMESALVERAYRREIAKAKSELQHLSQEEKDELMFEYYQQAREILSQLAFKGFCQQQLVLSPAVLREVFAEARVKVKDRSRLIQTLLSLGFLKPALGEHVDDPVGYEFLHLTFQEYYAACHIASFFRNKDAADIPTLTQMKNDPRYQIVWWFVSGVLKTEPEVWLRFMEFLQDPLSQDLLGHYHLGLLVRCTEEAFDLAQTTGVIVPIREAVQAYFSGLFELHRKSLVPWEFNSPLLVALRMSPRWLAAARPEDDVLAHVLPLIVGEGEEERDLSFSFFHVVMLPTQGALDHLAVSLESYPPFNSEIYLVEKLGSAAATPAILSGLANAVVITDRDKRGDGVFITGLMAKTATALIGKLATTSMMPAVLKRFVDFLAVPNPYIQLNAAEALGDLGGATPAVLRDLARLLGDRDSQVCWGAAKAIDYLGAPAATPAILAGLASWLEDEDHENAGLRCVVMSAIHDFGVVAATSEILEALKGLLLGGESDFLRVRAGKALGNLGVAAATPEVLAGLAKLREEVSWEDRIVLSEAIGNLRFAAAVAVIDELGAAAATPAVLEGLARLLGNEEAYIREEAGNAIGRLGAAAATPEFLEYLASLLGDENWGLRQGVVYAIYQLGAAAAIPAILSGLSNLLRDAHKNVRAIAVGVLTELGAASMMPAILASLPSLLVDEDSEVREAAARAIDYLGTAATPAILQGLADLLRDVDRYVRDETVVAISKLSTAALLTAKSLPDPLMFLGAYLGGSIQLHLQWNNHTQAYALTGWHGKTPIDIPLSLHEAQLLRHQMPRMIESIHQLDFSIIPGLWRNAVLPAVEKDALLPEYCASLSQARVSQPAGASAASANPRAFFAGDRGKRAAAGVVAVIEDSHAPTP